MIDKDAMSELRDLRQELHQHPELSGQEYATAKTIRSFFDSLMPDETLTQLGGEGLAFIYQGTEEGPTTLIRCELDGLPIREDGDRSYKSTSTGKSHACGHDGHMAIVSGVGKALAASPPKKGKVILLFQPAEETGEGAAKMMGSKKFDSIQPDYAFALHNLPGYATNSILIRKGVFAAASKGLEIRLKGRTSHAAFPEDGNSPAAALAKIILGLEELPGLVQGFSLVTVVHALLGEISFGTTPGDAVVRSTLRSFDDHAMTQLTRLSEEVVQQICRLHGLSFEISYTESFDATVNHPEACAMVEKAANSSNYDLICMEEPFRWSEDFGRFSQVAKTTLFGVGAGVHHPQLHESRYDFPDEIIGTGVEMFLSILKQTNY